MYDYIEKYSLSVIPIRKGEKKPDITSWMPYQQRLPTQSELDSWFSEGHKKNIAVVTGHLSGIVVLDLDEKNGKSASKTLAELGYELPEVTVIARTPSGGWHYYFKHPGFHVSTRAGVLEGIDIRGDGGCTVLPPSKLQEGSYEWLFSPDSTPIADMPEWLQDLCKPVERAPRAVEAPMEWEKEVGRLKQALSFCDASSRDDWAWHGGAIYDACGGSEEGFKVWDNWSKTCTDKYDAKEQKRYWETQFDNHRGNRRSIASIYAEALENGWKELDVLSNKNDIETINLDGSDVCHNGVSPSIISMKNLKKKFDEEYNHYPSDEHYRGLEHISKVISWMALDSLNNYFYISFLPPGMGKTTTVIETVKTIIDLDIDAGIIIFLSRLEEITKLVDEMNLDDKDYAILVRQNAENDKLYNNRGNPIRANARVLFTTQQMLEARSVDKCFSDINEFYYKEKPRKVRIWDEAILPSKILTLSRYDISDLFKGLRRESLELVSELETFFYDLKDIKDGEKIVIPDIEKYEIPLERATAAFDHPEDMEAVEAVWKLSGRFVRVRKDLENTVLDYDDFLPNDLAPMLILDASGEHRLTYRFWSESRKGLKFLPSAPKSYKGFTIHDWNKGAGKSTQKTNPKPIIKAVIDTINNHIPKDEDVLVVYFLKQHNRDIDVREEIEKGITDNKDRIKFLNWGKHTATNEFQTVKHVIHVGVLQYGASTYEATGRASKKLRVEELLSESDYQAVRLGEIAHNVFQAACRGAVRKAVGNGCPEGCHLWTIIPIKKGTGITEDFLTSVFPDADVVNWLPALPNLSQKQTKVITELVRLKGKTTKKQDLANKLELKATNLMRDINNDKIQVHLKLKGINVTHKGQYMTIN